MARRYGRGRRADTLRASPHACNLASDTGSPPDREARGYSGPVPSRYLLWGTIAAGLSHTGLDWAGNDRTPPRRPPGMGAAVRIDRGSKPFCDGPGVWDGSISV